jgi:4-carboxymuconolactone decarboxylase
VAETDGADADEGAGRAPWLRPDQLDAAQREVYDAITSGPRASNARLTPLADAQGRLYGPFNAMLLNPALGNALQALGAAIRYGSTLPGRAREIAILEVARIERSEFEWYAHAAAGASAGLTSIELEAVRVGAALELAATESVVRRVAQALVQTGDLDDELFALADQQLGTPLLNEVITLVGYYSLLATSMRVWRTPLPPGVDPVF